VIRSFRNPLTKAVFNGEWHKGFPPQLLKVARRKLAMLNAAVELKDLKSPPGNRLHQLGRDRAGQMAIRINDQFRVCFEWRDGDAFNVEVTDYHD
jgi:proteic killer suppression protein